MNAIVSADRKHGPLLSKMIDSLAHKYSGDTDEELLSYYKDQHENSYMYESDWARAAISHQNTGVAAALNERAKDNPALSTLIQESNLQDFIEDDIAKIDEQCEKVEQGYRNTPSAISLDSSFHDTEYFLDRFLYLDALEQYDLEAHRKEIQGIPALQDGLHYMANIWAQALVTDGIISSFNDPAVDQKMADMKANFSKSNAQPPPTPEQLKNFKDNLVGILNEASTTSIKCGYHASEILNEAAGRSGIKINPFSFPKSANTWLNAAMTQTGDIQLQSVEIETERGAKSFSVPAADITGRSLPGPARSPALPNLQNS